MAAQNQAAELDLARSRAETELRQVRAQLDGELRRSKTALADATAQAAGALQKLAEAQTAHAGQVAALQAELTSAVRKAHDLELQLVRVTALLEAKGIQAPGAEARKVKHAKETRDQP